jgi:hypothetical protein
MLMVLASVRLIEFHKQLSSVQSVTLISAGFCYIRTALNAQKKKVHKIICLGKFQSFRRIRVIAESAVSFIKSVRLPVRPQGKLE